jgi:Flp pilus assembly protein TadG
VTERGQAIVEFALVMPIMLTILLGVAGVFYLDLSTRKMQQGVDILAQLAAQSPSWTAKVADENVRANCNASPLQPEVAYPDGGKKPKKGDRIRLTWSCHLRTRWLFDGAPITVESEAVIE